MSGYQFMRVRQLAQQTWLHHDYVRHTVARLWGFA